MLIVSPHTLVSNTMVWINFEPLYNLLKGGLTFFLGCAKITEVSARGLLL